MRVGKAGVDDIAWKVAKEVNDDVIEGDGFCGVKLHLYFFKKSLPNAMLMLWLEDLFAQLEQ